jgi:hypothetical protein
MKPANPASAPLSHKGGEDNALRRKTRDARRVWVRADSIEPPPPRRVTGDELKKDDNDQQRE